MTWLGILTAILRLADALAGHLDKRQMLDAGEARAIRDGLARVQERVARARAVAGRAHSLDDDLGEL